MRTTLDIDDDVLAAAKERAAGQKTTTGKVISDLARQGLTRPAAGSLIERNGFLPLSISSHHAELAGHLAWSHPDPFDRMLIAQAQHDGKMRLRPLLVTQRRDRAVGGTV